ncbi:MAG: bifunctional glutamine synthetase adenylyltransferase/deadenyltransferase, partial [Endozoicomonas sp. (ex Botrylloides leachii)]|nr:bifunctional glutamine synthetase adenylyltransferase/deadenyltransferase [Endozoicomonas sp. (ex Botrylloides leachii)]
MMLPGSYPQCMAQELEQRWQQLVAYFHKQGQADKLKACKTDFLAQLFTTWSGSDFVAEAFTRYPEYLLYFYTLFQTNGFVLTDLAHHQNELSQWLKHVHSEESLMKQLRRYRNREMIRIIWQDLNRLVSLQEITRDLSALANACLEHALTWLYKNLTATLGTPVGGAFGEESAPQQLVIIGMGKLGADELNMSSDIDLLFAYPHQGETTGGPRVLTNQEFFIRLGQRLIKVLETRTAEGFVFRVDMRLRPYGDSGPLVMSFSAMEQYYQDQGRDWERYAMIKAQIVAGDKSQGNMLLVKLKPFVYRRYIDFSVITSLRDMKKLIEREVKRKGMESNIKLGPGGIREIEFITQSFQLIHGGKDRHLQKRALLDVL